MQVHREFYFFLGADQVVNSLMDCWPEWKEKLILLSKLESKSRPTIKKALDKLENENYEESEGKLICKIRIVMIIPDIDFTDYYCVDLLLKLLFPRSCKNKEVFFEALQGKHIQYV